nr:hypothetical protein [Kibdelosporangium sp. MJ126-NF4]CTQ97986.1 hypothetical protein [Kibdelosporangium sp. MJ126-NF4]
MPGGTALLPSHSGRNWTVRVRPDCHRRTEQLPPRGIQRITMGVLACGQPIDTGIAGALWTVFVTPRHWPSCSVIGPLGTVRCTESSVRRSVTASRTENCHPA